MRPFRRACVACLLIVSICLVPLVSCYDEDEENKRQAEAQRQLQAQLEEEHARRCQAEQAQSTWTIGIGAGACVACVIVGLVGVAIGSRALKRSGKEGTDG